MSQGLGAAHQKLLSCKHTDLYTKIQQCVTLSYDVVSHP